MTKQRFRGTLTIKKEVYVFAKNRTEARAKIKDKLSNQKASNFVSLEYLDDICY